MPTLVLLRHGESIWNRARRFSGWTDVDLTHEGIQEAHDAARLLMDGGYSFDVAFTSVLKRAIRTLWFVLDDMDLAWLPVRRSWRLNERHYGALQGLNKVETAERFGEQQIHAWRRSYDVRPPALTTDDPRYPGHDPRYAGLRPDELPLTECLRDTVERFMPCWHDEIVPEIRTGRHVLIVAHGNTLRALVKHLDETPDDGIAALDIPTGIPLVYELDEELRPVCHFYLGDQETARQAAEAVAAQAQEGPAAGKPDADGALELLTAGNRRFASDRPLHPHTGADRLEQAGA